MTILVQSSTAVLPELQPAHSCGLPVSMRAGCVLPSDPDAEPVDMCNQKAEMKLV